MTEPMEALDALLARRGLHVEDALVRAGLRGIVIAADGAGRSLVSLVGPRVDPSSLRERPGWDLPLQSVEPVETDGGDRTLIVEELPAGVSMIRLGDPFSDRQESRGIALFERSLAERFASAHEAGSTVGRLVPEVIFVDPGSMALVGCAQRALRADAAAAPIDGAGRLFGAAYLAPNAIQGRPTTADDDVFLLAALLWRWRHGTDPFEGPLLERITRTVAGGPVSSASADGVRGVDPLDELLLRAFAAIPERRPSAAELLTALVPNRVR